MESKLDHFVFLIFLLPSLFNSLIKFIKINLIISEVSRKILLAFKRGETLTALRR